MRSWPLLGGNVRPLRAGCSVGGWRQEIAGGFVLESETAEGLLRGGQRRKEGASGGMEASQVCSFISTTAPHLPPRPISKAESGGMGARTTLLAHTRQYPPVPACGVCVSGDKVLQLTAQAPSSFQWMTASLSQGSPLPKGQKATPFSYFPGSPSWLSSVVSLISGSDIQDRRKKRLKVIMVL